MLVNTGALVSRGQCTLTVDFPEEIINIIGSLLGLQFNCILMTVNVQSKSSDCIW